MRDLTIPVLALCAIAAVADVTAASNSSEPKIPAPQVSVPRGQPAASPSPAGGTPSTVPYQTVTVSRSSSAATTSSSTPADDAAAAAPAPSASYETVTLQPSTSTSTSTPDGGAPAPTVIEVKPASAPTIDAVGNVDAPVPGTGFGSETRSWTALQVSGAAAVQDERPLPGEVANKIYDRYVQSFTHPIPERFPQDSFSTSSGGGGGGSTR